ncbi:MmcQ/YjbR family DNA-binding protein [Paenibacillus tarimensis]
MAPESNMKTPEGLKMLKQVRHICEPLPEVEEIIDGFGHTTFKVRGKSFVIMGEHEGAGISLKSDLETQEILLQQGPFYKTPYIGHHGWVSIRHPQDWDMLGELIKEAYLRAAPKRLVKQLLGFQ